MSILIAEDMAFQRDYLRAIITDNFAEAGPVIEAADGNSAVELALKHRPSLAVLVDEQCWIDPEIRTVQSRATNRTSSLTDIEYEALKD